jgi:hypothetical protein
MLPNAKFVGIESLSFGSNDMSHVQVKRRLPDVAPSNVAHSPRSSAKHTSPQLKEVQGKTSSSLAAARRVFNTVRLSAHAAREAEGRVDFRAKAKAGESQP